MNLSELQNLNLDIHNIGGWPLPVRIAAIAAVSIAVLAAGFWIDTSPQLDALDAAKKKEVELKQTFEQKQAKAANLDLYKQQMGEMERSFGALLRQLPSKTEVADLLAEVSTAGVINGLEFELFQPEAEKPLEFYAELPINIKVSGSYHDFGKFVSDVAALPRIVTLNDFTITNTKNSGTLLMQTMAKTYRYLDEEEAANQVAEKKEAEKAKAKTKKK